MRRALGFLLWTALAWCQSGEEFFEKQVRPIFAAKCYACHGPKTQMAGLNLAASAASVVQPKDPAQSRLFRAVSYAEAVKMPPSGQLPPAEIATLKTWIEMGAPWPTTAGSPVPFSGKRIITAADREHWAFQPVKTAPPPSVRNESWVQSPIDRFILAKLEAKGLRPAPAVARTTLLRRATYDLTGLPPTPAEIEDFERDQSEDAYQKVVERLLASPRYGERWGRHWLDVARYADSTGMDEDHLYPHAWRYRDYVVKAFNDDLPYDRFVKEQLAGDLLPATQPGERQRGIVATGFLALGPKPLAQQDRVQMVYDVVDEQIDATSRAFLGLTIACARCHDHKFDPILTKDYYSMASIFAGTMSFRNLGRPGSVSFINYVPLDTAAYQRYQTHKFRTYGKRLELEEAQSEDAQRENAMLRPRVAEMLIAVWKANHQAAQPRNKEEEKWAPWLKSADEKARQGYLKNWLEATDATIEAVARDYQKHFDEAAAKWDKALDSWRKRFATEALEDRDVPARPKPNAEESPFFAAVAFEGGPLALADSERVAALRREWKDLEAHSPPEPPMASAVTEGANVEQRVFLHGDHHIQGEAVSKTFPVVLAGDAQTPAAQGSGRLELANWIARPDNPLTARVMVNRVWQWHFGEPLMRTPNNWGKTGDVPVQRELLDYLARSFMDHGWSVKALHRAILLSSAYQMGVSASREAQEADPQNRLLSHANRLRMSAEEIRDSILFLDGSLDETVGGSLLAAQPQKKTKANPEDTARRTLYIPVRRGKVPTVLATFDFGDATTPSEGRPRSNVAPQALFMMNSATVRERSRGFARKLLEPSDLSDALRVERAYLAVLGRKPSAAETDESLSYIQAMQNRLADESARLTAWQSFCRVLISTNEFLYLN